MEFVYAWRQKAAYDCGRTAPRQPAPTLRGKASELTNFGLVDLSCLISIRPADTLPNFGPLVKKKVYHPLVPTPFGCCHGNYVTPDPKWLYYHVGTRKKRKKINSNCKL